MKRKLICTILTLALCAGLTVPTFAFSVDEACLRIGQADMNKVEWLKAPGTVTYSRAERDGPATSLSYTSSSGKATIKYETNEYGEPTEPFYVVDASGAIIVEPGVYSWISEFAGNYANVNRGELEQGRGIIDDTGKEIIEAKYYRVSYPGDGLLGVNCFNYEEERMEWGYIDMSGKWVIGPNTNGRFLEDDYAGGDGSAFHNGTAVVINNIAPPEAPNTVYGTVLIDKNGNRLLSNVFFMTSNVSSYKVNDEPGKGGTEFIIWYGGGILVDVADVGLGIMRIPTEPKPITVRPTPSTVYVNGVETAFEAYNIGGSNYFKLRDLAYVLNGTEKQFEVGYDNDTRAITLTSDKPYTPTGNQEMIQGDGKAKTATPSASKIYLDGEELSLTVYNIGGNNFFKLRDLMEAVDVYVGYDSATKAITLDTSEGYVAE